MIDTVRFKLFSSPFKVANSDWVKESGTRDREDGTVAWQCFRHKESDLRVYGTEGMVTSLEVSLPKLIFDSNGILLRFEDVNPAYFSALDLASDVAENITPEKLWRYDLVHHFEGWAWDYIAALKGLKHRKVRRRYREFFDSGLEWPGKDVHIRLYDKKLELQNQPGAIQRLEFQLRNKAMQNVWSLESGFDVNLCYKQYRDLCSGFSSRSVPHISSTNDLLLFLKENNVMVMGIDPVERYMAGKSKRTRYRIESELKNVQLSYFQALFMDFLPDDPSGLKYLDVIEENQKLLA